MVIAAAILETLCSKLFFRTCVANSLHNCAMKVKSHFMMLISLELKKSSQQQLKRVSCGCHTD